MAMALYEPGAGYYRRGTRSIGRGGDFFTSVSVGAVFGELLSLYCAEVWHTLGSPKDFTVIEQGAHDGQLAADLWRGLQKHEPELAGRLRYCIIEPDESLRAAQRASLGNWIQQVDHVATLKESSHPPPHALFLCNELLDAFPVHRVVFDSARSQWQESFVEDRAGALAFISGDPSVDELSDELRRLPTNVPDGHTTEINLDMVRWLREIAQVPFRGAILILDYGFTMDEWLESGNPLGTLCRYRSHQSDRRVLENLGACDLTSHVNFTRLAQEAESLKMPVLEFIEQGRFLTQTAAACLGKTGAAPDATWLRQFQTLTHPGMMGRSFHALVLGKGLEASTLAALEKQAIARRRLGF
jgi:SAM-dependent MidA family methyltransferase